MITRKQDFFLRNGQKLANQLHIMAPPIYTERLSYIINVIHGRQTLAIRAACATGSSNQTHCWTSRSVCIFNRKVSVCTSPGECGQGGRR